MEISGTDSTGLFYRPLTPSERINSRQTPRLLTGHTNSLNPCDKICWIDGQVTLG